MSGPGKDRRVRLRNRMMAAFAAFTVLVTGVFGMFAVLFAYAVEDQLIAGLLEREAQRQVAHVAVHGQWTQPRHDWMQVVDDPAKLPAGIAQLLREEPRRVEFAAADGRHYHLTALPADDGRASAWLVGEVGSLLVIRPHRDAWLKLLAGTGLLMVLVALGLGLWLSHRTTAAISRLAESIDQTAPENLPPDLARDFGRDEAGILARALESLVERVRSLLAREREFSRDAGHELRTPLTVIRAACERLALEPGVTPDMRASLRHIQQSASQLEQTVGTLMLLAREETAAQAAAPVQLLPLVERAIVDQASLLEGKPIEVVVSVPSGLRTSVPESVIGILLANLVGNAFAHTAGGRVLIEADGERIVVSNPGSKLPAGAFEAYVKSESSAGLGLGLSIVRRLCERYGLDLATDESGGEVKVTLGLRPGAR